MFYVYFNNHHVVQTNSTIFHTVKQHIHIVTLISLSRIISELLQKVWSDNYVQSILKSNNCYIRVAEKRNISRSKGGEGSVTGVTDTDACEFGPKTLQKNVHISNTRS